MSRKIIHLDCDCFFAAVEERDQPSLRGLPIAVGGKAEQRGVIATCNYPARAFGVRSAMATSHAYRLCPSLTLVAPNFKKYRQASAQIQQIFLRYSTLVEPLSLDEAYLDVSDCPLFDNSATRIAEAIRQEVKAVTGLTISAGVAPNKFLAKVASDWRKPDGLFTIAPAQIADFISQLPVKRIPGVGPATRTKMSAIGITHCADLQRLSRLQLQQTFGSFGEKLFHLCRGEDKRPVVSNRRHKSVSVETTFNQDKTHFEQWQEALLALLSDLERRIRKLDNSYAIAGLFAKVRFSDFSQQTIQASGKPATAEAFMVLIEQLWAKNSAPIRLLGIGIKLKDELTPRQPDLFSEEKQQALAQQRLGML